MMNMIWKSMYILGTDAIVAIIIATAKFMIKFSLMLFGIEIVIAITLLVFMPVITDSWSKMNAREEER